jgi:phosphoglycerol transferase
VIAGAREPDRPVGRVDRFPGPHVVVLLQTIDPETADAGDDVQVDADAHRLPWTERLGFPAGVRPLREAALVCVVVAPIVTVLYRLWKAHWKVPFNYFGDGISTAAYSKAILTNGWYLSNSRLAAPFHADLRDFPVGGENLHWVVIKMLGYATRNYAVASNAYFVLGFFLIALAAYFVARYLRFSIATSLGVGVIYAFLPYHAYRNYGHLTRGIYYSVPLAMLVLFWAINYRTEYFTRAEGGALTWRRGRILTVVIFCAIVGASDTQNAAFLVTILTVIAVVAAARDRDWRPLALLAIVGAATFGSLLVNNVPFVMSRVERGPNTVAANRPLSDQDYYALRPLDLILPAPGHRVKALAKLEVKGDQGKTTNNEAGGTPLGTFGTIGFLWSIGAVLALGLGMRARNAETKFVAQIGGLNVICILVGAIGGFAYLIALEGFGMYRTWNRISLFIAFGSVLATAVLLERLFRFIRSKATKLVALGIISAVVAVVCVGGAYDQVTPRYVFNYQNTATRFDTDATFYHDLEKSVPKGSMMFQAPFEQFPEAGTIVSMTDYQDFTGYLHTKTLRWNYGGMKGRPEGDWEQNLSIYDPVAMVSSVAAVGFQGMVIDRSGLVKNGEDFLKAVTPFTGPVLLHSADDRLLYVDLTALHARLVRELGADAVEKGKQVILGNTITWSGFSFPEPLQPCGTRRWATSRTASITVDAGNAPVTSTVSTQFEANPAARSIAVHAPGVDTSAPLSNGTGRFEQQITLPAGKSTISFTLNGPAVVKPAGELRTLQFSLVDPELGQQFDSPVVTWAHNQGTTCPTG